MPLGSFRWVSPNTQDTDTEAAFRMARKPSELVQPFLKLRADLDTLWKASQMGVALLMVEWAVPCLCLVILSYSIMYVPGGHPSMAMRGLSSFFAIGGFLFAWTLASFVYECAAISSECMSADKGKRELNFREFFHCTPKSLGCVSKLCPLSLATEQKQRERYGLRGELMRMSEAVQPADCELKEALALLQLQHILKESRMGVKIFGQLVEWKVLGTVMISAAVSFMHLGVFISNPNDFHILGSFNGTANATSLFPNF